MLFSLGPPTYPFLEHKFTVFTTTQPLPFHFVTLKTDIYNTADSSEVRFRLFSLSLCFEQQFSKHLTPQNILRFRFTPGGVAVDSANNITFL